MNAPGDRRRHPRFPCAIQAEVRSGAAFAQERPLLDISEDGAFSLVSPTLSPGTRATLRFRHPHVSRIVTTRAVVARRVPLSPGVEGPSPGLGFYLLESLSALGAERRVEERLPVDLPAVLSQDDKKAAVRIVDLSEWGAAVQIDLGLKRLTQGASSGQPREMLAISHLLRPGVEAVLSFVHPSNGEFLEARVLVARTPMPVGSESSEYRFGVRFERNLASLLTHSAPRGKAPPIITDKVRITGAVNLDRMASRELEMRSLLRGVSWLTSAGVSGRGRIVLAGADRLLLSSRFEPPAEGTTANITLETPDDSSVPPIGITVSVTRSGPGLVSDVEPGFICQIMHFLSLADEQRYKDLVRWLKHGPTAEG